MLVATLLTIPFLIVHASEYNMARPSHMNRNREKPSRPLPPDEEQALKALNLSDDYLVLVGLFQGAWASLELTTDYAIWKFLKVTREQAHLITSGIMFGRKARLLADLIGRSDHPNKAKILGAFNEVRGTMNKRDIFAHSYVWSDQNVVKFIDRQAGGEYKAKEHRFTLKQFRDYVLEFSLSAERFYLSLGATREEINVFGNAALSLNRRSTHPRARPITRHKDCRPTNRKMRALMRRELGHEASALG
jgi:hypothetical protein